MNIAVIREKIRRAGFFIPFRVHLLILVVALLLAAHWLRKNNAVPETAQTAIIDLFISVTCWFALAILVISFLSAFVPWIIFLSGKKKERSILTIKTAHNESVANQQQVEVTISHIIKPLFGYIRLRLFYDGNNISPKFAPVSFKTGSDFFSISTKGLYNWPLQNIKEYDINSGIIYFEDFFQFFSFTGKLPSNSNFFNGPPVKKTGPLVVQPKKTEDTNTRIEEMRKVEGELLNYKNFESNDDVRRIVWKIYAKNKELVVRIPETNDPYASHIYFYASFYNQISGDIYKEFNEVFLNNFKTAVWNIYDQLSRQNALIQYIPDQEIKKMYAGDPALKVKYLVSTASWQKQNNLENYFNSQYTSLLCVSSLADANQLSEILEKAGKSLTVIFLQLSKSFSTLTVTDWLQWLFIKPEKNSTEKLQLAFNLSPLRKTITENEKRIRQMLEKCACGVLIPDTCTEYQQ
ncbi:MAG: DUF58 domain-containing protein [Ginsengibacter sp.]